MASKSLKNPNLDISSVQILFGVIVCCTWALTKYGNPSSITTEVMDISLDPLKCLDLVHEAIIPFDSKQKDTRKWTTIQNIHAMTFDQFQQAES